MLTINYTFRTNLPKELMEYEDFPYKSINRSILLHEEVLSYINDYADTFNLRPSIQFFKHVTKVEPILESKWSVKSKDLKTNVERIEEYDAIFICVGNYSVPRIPKIEGDDDFKGEMIHSHGYRRPDQFKNRKVLVIGGGPSGTDISRIVAHVADKVYISISYENHLIEKYCNKVVVKPHVLKLTEDSVIFEDGSEEIIDQIIYCTGYLYCYPFLSPNCNIEVEDNWVKYLYKGVININHPTMAFIGIQFRTMIFPLFCVQVKFFLRYLKGCIAATKEEMMKDLNQYMQKKKELGEPTHYAHYLGPQQGLMYFDDLAEIAHIKKVPPVIHKLYDHFLFSGNEKYDMSYRILNDDEFEESLLV